MWFGTLRGYDIQQATAELKSQRAAIRARYDVEMKQLETKIADLEMLEHHVLNFVSTFKGEDEPSATVANAAPVAERAFVSTFKVEDEPSATVANLAPAAEKAL